MLDPDREDVHHLRAQLYFVLRRRREGLDAVHQLLRLAPHRRDEYAKDFPIISIHPSFRRYFRD
jgi:hypothetical protein